MAGLNYIRGYLFRKVYLFAFILIKQNFHLFYRNIALSLNSNIPIFVLNVGGL